MTSPRIRGPCKQAEVPGLEDCFRAANGIEGPIIKFDGGIKNFVRAFKHMGGGLN